MMELGTIAKRVKNGAEFLDETIPNWWKWIDITTLNMGRGFYRPPDVCGCVGAQLDYFGGSGEQGSWRSFRNTLLFTQEEMPEFLGLLISSKEERQPEIMVGFYDSLTEEWIRVIKERRKSINE